MAGAAAGLTNTIRGVTSIIGVAVLGAVYSLQYQGLITPDLDAADTELPAGANRSLSQTLTALREINSADPGATSRLVSDAEAAFVQSFHAGIWVAVAVLLVGLLLGLVLLPRKQRAGRHSPA